MDDSIPAQPPQQMPEAEALGSTLQRDRLVDLERALSAVYGPIPDDVQRRVDQTPWPR